MFFLSKFCGPPGTFESNLFPFSVSEIGCGTQIPGYPVLDHPDTVTVIPHRCNVSHMHCTSICSCFLGQVLGDSRALLSHNTRTYPGTYAYPGTKGTRVPTRSRMGSGSRSSEGGGPSRYPGARDLWLVLPRHYQCKSLFAKSALYVYYE
jgi:hypothetical protein